MSSNLVSYCRVSTVDQSTAQQRMVLDKLNPVRTFEDCISGAKDDRPGLNALLDYVREGDVVVVWKLDRLGRDMLHILQVVEQLKNKGVHLKSITDNVDTTTPVGELMLGLMSSFAQYERSLIRERTALQRQMARENGVKFGRKPKLTEAQVKLMRTMKAEKHSGQDIANALGISRASVYNYLNS